MPIRRTAGSAPDTRATAGAMLLLAAWAYCIPFARAQNESCTPQMARLVSLQGAVELRPAAKRQWQRINRLDTPLCKGDLLRTGPSSRALLFIPSENLLRVDQNTTISVHVQQDETIVEFFIDEASRGAACGAGYAISRFPRKFKVDTPFSHAAVEGTEFLVALSCTRATVSVFEGKVSVAERVAQASRVVLGPGQTTSVGPGQPPVVQVLLKPTDAVQWALFYPPLADRQFGTDPLHAPCETVARDERPACLLARAEALVGAGQIEQAQADIRELLALRPDDGDAYALRAVIGVARNEKAEALQFAHQATKLSPNAPRPWLALSYAQQAHFELEAALESAQKAAALAPASGLVQARVAELLLSLGRVGQAERAARQAVAVDPRQSRGYVILGFVQLVQIDVRSARQSFEQAVELDSTDPLPRLGLGLASIREGNLEAGRQQIEIAVALDPANSLLRSYLGKAYYEENTRERDKLAAAQYSLAKELDPRDPTPWYYDAILEKAQNRPVEALEALEKSTALNDDRAVYRSRFLLDQDLATRETSLGTVYRDLGFESLGWVAAVRALDSNPTNYSAHRFLSDLDAATPGLEVARVSELLQAQLLQPLTLNSIQPRLAESDLVALDHIGPWDPSFNEYTSMFASDRVSANLNLLAGTNNTIGQELTLAAVQGRFSVSAGNFYYQSDGFRENNDYTDSIVGAFGQIELSESTSLQVEVRTRDLDHGDISLRLSEPAFSPAYGRSVDANTGRIGFRHRFRQGSDLLLSWISQRVTESQHDERSFVDPDYGPLLLKVSGTRTDSASLSEIQYLHQWSDVHLIVGAGYADSDASLQDTFEIIPIVPPTPDNQDLSTIQETAYGYVYIRPNDTFTLIGGLSGATYERRDIYRSQLNPKLGAMLRASPSTTLRAAAFRTMKRELVTDQTLEPTQVAGFNQFFDDVNAADAWRVGAALDQRFGPKLWGGVEVSARWVTGPFDELSVDSDAEEHLSRAYLSWIPTSKLALGLNYQFQGFDREVPPSDSTRPDSLHTNFAAFTAALYPYHGLFLKLRATHVSQDAQFIVSTAAPAIDAGDDFWVVDATIGVRSPRRWGSFSIGVTNLFDTHFRFQDLNSMTNQARLPPFVPERQFFARVNLAF